MRWLRWPRRHQHRWYPVERFSGDWTVAYLVAWECQCGQRRDPEPGDVLRRSL